ncbi:MAG: M16 family metallopeptidase [Thermoanaerobaculales bacterium]
MKISIPRRPLLAVCMLLIVDFVVYSLPAVAADEPALEGSVERVLPSGARALLMPRPGSGTVLLAVAVPAGSQDEPQEMAGLSHYLEHLLFDGFDDLDERGVTEAFERRSVYMNAFTREQTTVFFALAPREEAEATAELVAGMLTRSTIVPATYAKEKKVILEELAKDHASPDGLKNELLRSLLWQGTPLQHPVGGSVESVQATTREEVVRYWREHYGASGYRVLVTGDLPVAGLEEVLSPFRGLPASDPFPARRDPVTWPGWGEWAAAPAPAAAEEGGSMPPMGSGMGRGMPTGGAGANGGTLVLVVAAPDEMTGAGAELEVLVRWLGSARGPLASVLIPQLATDVSTTLMPRDPRDLIEVRVEAVEGGDPQAVLGALLGGLDAAAVGPEDSQVMDIQRAWMAERALVGQRLHYAAVFYGEALAAARGPLSEALEPSEVSPEMVRAAAAALLGGAENRLRAAWVGSSGPVERTPLPEAVPVGELPATSSLEPGPLGSLVTTLDNGLMVGIVPELGSPVFGIHLLIADRTLNEPDGMQGIGDLIHRLLPGGSVLAGSRELARRIERAGIEVKVADSPMIPFDNRYHVPDFSYVRLEGPSRGLETGLQILAEMIRVPAWDEDGWRGAVDAHSAERKADNRGGEKAKQVFFASLLGPEHPLSKPVSGPLGTEIPDQETVKEVWGTWPEGYFAPDRLVLTVTSPLPAEQTVAMVEDAFSGGSPADPRRGPYPDPRPSSVPAAIEVGDAPQVTVLWGRVAEVEEKDRAALLVAVDALSDRMVAVIREREGLAYRLGAGVRHLPGGAWILSASVGTRPENRERVAALLEELVEGLAAEPMSPEDLTRLESRRRRSTMLRGLSAASRAYKLGRVLFEGADSPLMIGETATAGATPEQVQAAAKKYLDPGKMLLVVTP